jgi:hypothetical protein
VNSEEIKHNSPGEARGDGQAQHGYRNEVSWDGGKGRQPYTNQGEQEQGPAAGGTFEGGDRGDVSGRNVDQFDEVSGKPEPTRGEATRET